MQSGRVQQYHLPSTDIGLGKQPFTKLNVVVATYVVAFQSFRSPKAQKFLRRQTPDYRDYRLESVRISTFLQHILTNLASGWNEHILSP
jgi:hypothetical protein